MLVVNNKLITNHRCHPGAISRECVLSSVLVALLKLGGVKKDTSASRLLAKPVVHLGKSCLASRVCPARADERSKEWQIISLALNPTQKVHYHHQLRLAIVASYYRRATCARQATALAATTCCCLTTTYYGQ